jgi:HPt (histidine-containing phosphotransfer) domain-containing protein
VSSSGDGGPEEDRPEDRLEDRPESLSLDERSLHEYFARRLPARLQEIEAGWRQVRETAWSEEPVKTFHRLVHSLAGAGTTFGFAAVTEAARALEIRLKAVVRGLEPHPDDATVEGLLEGLRAAARPAP